MNNNLKKGGDDTHGTNQPFMPEHMPTDNGFQQRPEISKPESRGDLCQSCKKNAALELHSCPYNEDINNDPTPCCNCCAECQQECCDDI